MKNYFILITSIFFFACSSGQEDTSENSAKKKTTKPKVVITSTTNAPPANTVFTDSLCFTEYLKREESISINQTQEYLFSFNNKEYSRIVNDEFEYNETIKDVKNSLETEIIEQNKVYTLMYVAEVGNYDFEKKGFNIDWGRYYTRFFYEGEWIGIGDVNNEYMTYTAIFLDFNNINSISFIPVDAEIAKQFVKKNKTSSGGVDRRIHLKLYVNIDSVYNAPTEGTLARAIPKKRSGLSFAWEQKGQEFLERTVKVMDFNIIRIDAYGTKEGGTFKKLVYKDLLNSISIQ